mmetsp:Transcript_13972/g.37335  ORF Transcript_13972/g.37335 Transcript_13972/m.37335 type:complete len:385 (-) Transcript_13972:127-1281(-)
MEDAMVINKASLERGFGNAFVYTSQVIDLDEESYGKDAVFGVSEEHNTLRMDGLPEPGIPVQSGDPIRSIISKIDSKVLRAVKYKPNEPGTIDDVRVLESSKERGPNGARRIIIRYRHLRNAVIGDKLASRHGQKGVLSALWPTQDMPYTESGIIPDILFNPNGFPSRMTIGMMVETMSGKSAAVHGAFHDSTPFRFDDNVRATDFFGEQLLKAGYNYHGNEVMYSGYTGEPFKVDIFMGVVHYQRLRHMVSDKFQVRSTGPIDPLTKQPLHGRKRGGAIRFGEMERDALIGHGAAYLLHDRLSVCSDLYSMFACKSCGSILTPCRDKSGAAASATTAPSGGGSIFCRSCAGGGDVKRITLPYVFKYLTNELASMNIRTLLSLS